jgi:hypothetical protein
MRRLGRCLHLNTCLSGGPQQSAYQAIHCPTLEWRSCQCTLKYMLDTNALIYVVNKTPASVVARMNALDETDILCMS